MINPFTNGLQRFNVDRRWTRPLIGYDEYAMMMGGAYNENSIRCTNRNIRIGVRGTPGTCFRRGLQVGYRAGLAKSQQQQRPDLENMSLRMLGDLASKNGIRGYSRMTKRELYDRLVEIYGAPPQN